MSRRYMLTSLREESAEAVIRIRGLALLGKIAIGLESAVTSAMHAPDETERRKGHT